MATKLKYFSLLIIILLLLSSCSLPTSYDTIVYQIYTLDGKYIDECKRVERDIAGLLIRNCLKSDGISGDVMWIEKKVTVEINN